MAADGVDDGDAGAADVAGNDGAGAAAAGAAGKPAGADKSAVGADKGAAAAGGAQKVDPSLAAGGAAKDDAVKPAWADDWAERFAGKDKARLNWAKRYSSPVDALAAGYAAQSMIREGGLIKVPGEKATPEEQAAYRKAMGVPEKPEDYFEQIKMPDGKALGEADKPIADGFAKAMHTVGAPPSVVGAALGWYFNQQEQAATDMAGADDNFRAESEASLKEDWGPKFKGNVNAIGTLFAEAPGGANVDAEGGLMQRLLGGRTADGKRIGDDPDVMRWLVKTAMDVNPAATLVPAGPDQGKSVNDEIGQIETTMKTDRNKYWNDPAMQKRYGELLAARETMQSRGKSA